MRSRRDVLFAALFAVAATAVLLYPLSLHPAALGRADSPDGRFNIWNVAWVARTVVVDPRHLLDANIFFPHHDALAYSELNIGAGLLAIPGYWLTRNPYVAYNSAALLMFVLSALTTWFLVRRLTGSAGAAAISAICFPFCPYVFSNTAEIQLMMTAGFPLTMLAFHALVDRPSAWRGVLVGLAVALTGLFCAYYGTFDGLMVAWGAVIVAATRRQWTSIRYWTSFAMAGAVAVLAILPFFWPYLHLERDDHFARSFADTIRFSANWQAYLASGARADQWMLARIHGWTDVLFPGMVAILLAAVGIAAAVRRRGTVESGGAPDRAGETAILYGSIALLAGWLSFGPRAGLYLVPYRLFPPIFSLLRVPSRFGILVAFGLAVLAGSGAAALLRWLPRPRIVGLALCLVAIADVSVAVPVTPALPIPAVYQSLNTLPPGSVLELPIFWRPTDLPRNSIYMLFSTADWRPIVGGFSDFIPPDYRTALRVLSEFPTPESFRQLRTLRARYVIIHPGLYYDDASRAALRKRLERFAPYLRPLVSDGDTWLYEITAWPEGAVAASEADHGADVH